MAHVRTIDAAEAEGEILEAYQKITGQECPQRMANVYQSTSIRPRTLLAMARLNDEVNFLNDTSGLTRLQREMISTVVSANVKCRY